MLNICVFCHILSKEYKPEDQCLTLAVRQYEFSSGHYASFL